MHNEDLTLAPSHSMQREATNAYKLKGKESGFLSRARIGAKSRTLTLEGRQSGNHPLRDAVVK